METEPSSDAAIRLRGKENEEGVKKESEVTVAEWCSDPISEQVERS